MNECLNILLPRVAEENIHAIGIGSYKYKLFKCIFCVYACEQVMLSAPIKPFGFGGPQRTPSMRTAPSARHRNTGTEGTAQRRLLPAHPSASTAHSDALAMAAATGGVNISKVQ